MRKNENEKIKNETNEKEWNWQIWVA